LIYDFNHKKGVNDNFHAFSLSKKKNKI